MNVGLFLPNGNIYKSLYPGTCDFEAGTCGWNDLSAGSTMWAWSSASNATFPDINYDSQGIIGQGKFS